jgi:plastocyanin
MKKFVFTFFIVCLFIILFGSFSLVKNNYFHSQGKTYIVTITEDGFTPSELHIQQNDTILFKTTVKTAFWPASDPHPTHDIYPEFDPQEPIDADKTWSFTFAKAGTWKFHNHLDPSERGIVYVFQNK